MSEHEDEVHKDKKVYKIQIDKDHFEVTKAQPTTTTRSGTRSRPM